MHALREVKDLVRGRKMKKKKRKTDGEKRRICKLGQIHGQVSNIKKNS